MTASGTAVEGGLVDEAISDLLARYPRPDQVGAAEFLCAQFDAGLAWVHFDRGHGGLGVSRELQIGVARRLDAEGAPRTNGDFVATHQVAATIHAVGTEAQKRRHLRRIFTGDDHWCQLFSEPNAGSDLAGVASTARRDDDVWRVTGQKVWCSGAREASFGLLLARTDPNARKHAGLTMFLVNMHDPSVDVRPLRQADGGARFNEVFLNDVCVPDSARLGNVGEGWKISLSVLRTEREGASNVFLRPVDELLELWRERRSTVPEALRQDVVRAWVSARVIDWNDQRRRSAKDEEAAARLAAVAKVSASEHAQRLASVLAVVAGPQAQVGIDYDAAFEADLRQSSSSPTKFWTMPLPAFVIRCRAMSIEGGTNEIQRNIIGERVLGLPPETRVDKTVPWRESVPTPVKTIRE